jgi:hypothetical protein
LFRIQHRSFVVGETWRGRKLERAQQPDGTDPDGNGDGTAIVDMGAYEFGSYRYGDPNCDSVVDFDDINPFVAILSGGG